LTTSKHRIHLTVDDLEAEISRLRAAGLPFRSDLLTGPGGRQIRLTDPAGNLIELFQPADQFNAPNAGCAIPNKSQSGPTQTAAIQDQRFAGLGQPHKRRAR